MLLLQIELLDWKPEDLSPRGNGGILRHVIKKPVTRKTPNDGASVTVHLVGSHEGRVFDDRELTFSIGECSDDDVISGVQKALTHFGKGETSKYVSNAISWINISIKYFNEINWKTCSLDLSSIQNTHSVIKAMKHSKFHQKRPLNTLLH